MKDLEITVPMTWDTEPKTKEHRDRLLVELHNQAVEAKRRAKLLRRRARRKGK